MTTPNSQPEGTLEKRQPADSQNDASGPPSLAAGDALQQTAEPSTAQEPSVASEQERADGLVVEKVAFESKQPDRGYTVRASYLQPPNAGDALVEIFKDGQPLRSFLFPAYKIWNIAAHFRDIVDGEIEESAKGYETAAWDGISGATVILPAGGGSPKP